MKGYWQNFLRDKTHETLTSVWTWAGGGVSVDVRRPVGRMCRLLGCLWGRLAEVLTVGRSKESRMAQRPHILKVILPLPDLETDLCPRLQIYKEKPHFTLNDSQPYAGTQHKASPQASSHLAIANTVWKNLRGSRSVEKGPRPEK